MAFTGDPAFPKRLCKHKAEKVENLARLVLAFGPSLTSNATVKFSKGSEQSSIDNPFLYMSVKEMSE